MRSSIKFIKEKANEFIRCIVAFLFSILESQSLPDMAARLFGKYKTISFWVNQLSVLIIYLVYTSRAFQLSLPETLQILRASVYGPTGHRMAVVGALAHCQISAFWAWFSAIIRKYRSIDNIGFMQLLGKMKQDSQEKMHFLTKLVSINTAISCYSFALVFTGIEFYFASSIRHCWFILLAQCSLFLAARYAPNGVIVVYVYAIAGCNTVLDQMKQWLEFVENHPHLEALYHYKEVVQSIKQLNVLTKFIVLTSKMLVVPFGSMFFMVPSRKYIHLYFHLQPTTGFLSFSKCLY